MGWWNTLQRARGVWRYVRDASSACDQQFIEVRQEWVEVQTEMPKRMVVRPMAFRPSISTWEKPEATDGVRRRCHFESDLAFCFEAEYLRDSIEYHKQSKLTFS